MDYEAGAGDSDISIHALREEGDFDFACLNGTRFVISIHALREEGDVYYYCKAVNTAISIHALREEGDNKGCSKR